MAPVSRRTFLGSAAALGATLGLESLPGSTPQAAAAATGTIRDVKHVVVLMQENRSFDHYFGTLKGVRGFADRATIQLVRRRLGVQPAQRQRPAVPVAAEQHQHLVVGHHARRAGAVRRLAGPRLDTQHAAWNSGKMDNWISAKGSNRTMGYLTRTDIPFHYALADAYTVCDAYHCSILSRDRSEPHLPVVRHDRPGRDAPAARPTTAARSPG